MCGILVVMSYSLVIYFGFIQYRKKRRITQAAAEAAALINNNSDNNNSGSNVSGVGTGMLVSRSWMYGRTSGSVSTSTNNRYNSIDEERTSLLDSNRVEIESDKNRGKNKGEEARLYQTAVEYRCDTNEFYPLPRAPASAIISDL